MTENHGGPPPKPSASGFGGERKRPKRRLRRIKRGCFEEAARLAAPDRGRESQCRDGEQGATERREFSAAPEASRAEFVYGGSPLESSGAIPVGKGGARERAQLPAAREAKRCGLCDDDMTNILLALVLAMLVFVALLNMALYVRVVRKEQAVKAEEKIQAAMDDAAEEELRKSRSMDEGFDNIMGFQVKLGHGKSTGGEL